MKENFTLYGLIIMTLGTAIQYWNQIGMILLLNGLTIILSVTVFQFLRLVELKEREKKDEKY